MIESTINLTCIIYNDYLVDNRYSIELSLFLESNDIFAKEKFTKFFVTEMPKNIYYFKNDYDDIVYFSDMKNRRCIIDVQYRS